MLFSKLRLIGFKSFVEPVEFIIESGLTGVVGPNGCGKSNLIEALRWVMGENSYKNMRASGMDDVIFSGSRTRPARNMAEVTLFLDNQDRTAPPTYNNADELQVSRRIERKTGSAYRINGTEARAKDVQLLFADQSTGARSPSMVRQGHIGELIQVKSQARRALLEEAAGISGLHTRRHEAELRLRAAEINLERLEDVINELKTQIDNLKRQARQANRFKELSSAIRSSEAIFLHLKWLLAKTQGTEAQNALSMATVDVAEKAQAQMMLAREQAFSAQALPHLRNAEAKAAASLQHLTIARTQLNEEVERISSRRSELLKQLEHLTVDIRREEQIMSENAEILGNLDREETVLSAKNNAANERKIAICTAFESAGIKLKESETHLANVTVERADAMAERAHVERSLREIVDRRVRLEHQIQEVEHDLAIITTQITESVDPNQKRLAVEMAEKAVSSAEKEVMIAEEYVEQARAREITLRHLLDKTRSELNRIETEIRTLSKIVNIDSASLFPAIIEQLHVEKGFETALGAALGENLDAPIDKTAPVFWTDTGIGNDDPMLPENIPPLIQVVKAPHELARRLAQIGIIDDETHGPYLQKMLKPGQRIVSLAGALWRWDGYTANAGAPTLAAQRLAQKNRLIELEREIVEATNMFRAAEETMLSGEAMVHEAIKRDRVARDHWRAMQRTLNDAHETLGKAQHMATQFSNRYAALNEAKTHLITSFDETLVQFTETESRLARIADIEEVNTRFSTLSSEVMLDRAAFAEARGAYDSLHREIENCVRRLEAIARERKSWISRIQNADRQIKILTSRHAETGAEAEKIVNAPDEIERRHQTLLTQLSKAEALHKEATDKRIIAEAKQTEFDKLASQAVQDLAASREIRIRAEERVNAAQEKRQDAEARILETLNCLPHEAIRRTGLKPNDPMPDTDSIERQLEKLKIERERLGAVNLCADEEQQDLSKRLETILNEREDVIEAIKRLRQGILSLNHEGSERLLAAFAAVNAQFQRLFTHLFGGGSAELRLIESENPLEAGLDVLACPPGKKLQTMTLLSGGEQALTAMALIFAVFLTSPAPICVLDEVDAPLDDHNVERFCNLMDEMAASTKTRFIIITHNPITMARMNRLFGVTMAEQGVSQLVSVDLQTAESLREAS